MYQADRIQSVAEKPFSLVEDSFCDKSTWVDVADARAQFHAGGGTDALSSLVRPAVLESWIRSKNTGVVPDADQLCIRIDDAEYDRICVQYAFLVNEVEPLMPTIEQYEIPTDYSFELITRKGVSLLQAGRLPRDPYVRDRAILNESTMGTNAHSLCMRGKRLFSLFGPEHYCDALTKLAATAVPLVNQQGTVVASLLLTHLLPEEPWDEGYQRLLVELGNALRTMAATVESRWAQEYSHN